MIPMSHSHASAVRQYHDQGYAVWRRVLDPALIREADRFVDWILARNPDTRPENLNSPLTRHEPFLIRLVADPSLLDLAAAFLGPDIALYGAHFLCKPPRDGKPVAWHQDGGYWPLEPMEALTLWVAITASTPANGCMRVIPGTHRLGQLPFIHSEEGKNNVLDQSTVDIDSFAEPPIHLEMKAGQMSLHTDWLLHGSDANRSGRRRCGLTLRFTSPDVRNFTVAEGAGVIACGRDPSGYWQHQPRPAGEDIPDPPRPEDDWQRRSGWKRAWDDAQDR